MHRVVEAYIAGIAAGGCEVKPRPLLEGWLWKFSTEKSRVVLPRRYCRFTPVTLLEYIYFLKGAFEGHGEFFMADPHGDLIIIFRLHNSKVVKGLRLLGMDPLKTTDERGERNYIVLYKRGDVRRFVRLVKPVVEDPLVAAKLGICTQRSL